MNWRETTLAMTLEECLDSMWPVHIVSANDGERMFVHAGTARAYRRTLEEREESHMEYSESRMGHTFRKCADCNQASRLHSARQDAEHIVMWEKQDFIDAFADLVITKRVKK